MFSTIVYGSTHPYGNPTDGTDGSVKQISGDDVMEFYSTHFHPGNATLIIVGDAKLTTIKKLLEKYFADWKPKPVNPVIVPPVNGSVEAGIYMVDKPKAAQSQIRVGSIGVSRTTPDYFALEVMNMILGGNFNSRINWNLREQKGYTYGARSSFAYRKEAGPFSAGGGFKSSVTDSCVSELLGEIKRIRETDVTADELVFAKNGLIRALPRSFETLGQIAGQLSSLVLYNLPDDYYIPEKMTIVIVGDVELNKEPLEKLNLGKVNLLDANGKGVE